MALCLQRLCRHELASMRPVAQYIKNILRMTCGNASCTLFQIYLPKQVWASQQKGKNLGIQSENWIQRHQITVDQYYQMAQVGVLSPDDRVELIEGEIIDMAPIGSEHAGLVNQLTRASTKPSGIVQSLRRKIHCA